MKDETLNRIVEVSVRRGSHHHDIGIMSVRQALELPETPSLEYLHLAPNHQSALTRDQLQAYASA